MNLFRSIIAGSGLVLVFAFRAYSQNAPLTKDTTPTTKPSVEVQEQIPKIAQPPAMLRNRGGAGQALSHWLPGSPVPYPELISIDGKEPKDFGLKNNHCYGPRKDRRCTFGEKFNVSIPPGGHTLLVQFSALGYNSTTISSTEPLSLALPAASGHLYVLEAQYVVGGWVPFVVDATDKEHPHLIQSEQRAVDFALAFYTRGTEKLAKGDYDGAIEEFNRAIQLKPAYADAYTGRGTAKLAKGDNDGAIEEFNRAIQLKPQFADAYTGRGNAKRAKGDIDGANLDLATAAALR